VTPLGTGLDDLAVTMTVRTSGGGRFVISLCNVTVDPVSPPADGIAFSYVVFDVP
jgi:hypothetical protein